jgi:hypothetical protein
MVKKTESSTGPVGSIKWTPFGGSATYKEDGVFDRTRREGGPTTYKEDEVFDWALPLRVRRGRVLRYPPATGDW